MLHLRKVRTPEQPDGMLIRSAANEQGFSIRFWGSTSRHVEDFEGLTLIASPQSNESDPPVT